MRLEKEDISQCIRALFTHMGRMASEFNDVEYAQAKALVTRMRGELGLVPMTDKEMLGHSLMMYNANRLYR